MYMSKAISAAASGSSRTMMTALAWVHKYGLAAVCCEPPPELLPSNSGFGSGDQGHNSGSRWLSVAQQLAAADSLKIGSSQWFAAVLKALPVFPLAWLAQPGVAN